MNNNEEVIGKFLSSKNPTASYDNSTVKVIFNRDMIALGTIHKNSKNKLWFVPEKDVMFDEQCLIDIAVYIGKLKVNI
jgi:hypothetical protein